MWRLGILSVVFVMILGCKPSEEPTKVGAKRSEVAKLSPRELQIEQSASRWTESSQRGYRELKNLFRVVNAGQKMVKSFTVEVNWRDQVSGKTFTNSRTIEGKELESAGKLTQGILMPFHRTILYTLGVSVPASLSKNEFDFELKVTEAKKLVRNDNLEDPDQVLALIYYGKADEIEQAFRANPKLKNAKGPNGQTAFHYAAMQFDATVLNALVDLGMDPKATTKDGQTAFDFAVMSGPRTIIRLSKLGLRSSSTSSVHQAIRSFRSDQLPALKQAGIPMNKPDKMGRTPLIEAVIGGDIASVEKLLKLGAKKNTMDSYGITPLRAAFRWPDSSFIADVLRLCGGMESVDELGQTPIFFAFFENNPAGVELLIQNGANLRHKDKKGMTILDHIRKYRKESRRGEAIYGPMMKRLNLVP